MEPLVQFVVAVAATVTAAAACFGARWMYESAKYGRASYRYLSGEPDVEGDDGLVGRLDEVEDTAEYAVDLAEGNEQDVARAHHRLDNLDVATDGGRERENT